MIRPFLLALQFLTRIPTPTINEPSDREIGFSQYYYPVVGLVIGIILLAGAQFISLPSSQLNAALLLSLWVLITGALHLDGLADCADAWVGGYGNKDKTLAIMKDPQSGPVAVVLIVCVLLIKFTAIEAVISDKAWAALILSPVISRCMLPLLFRFTPYVRSNGLGSALTQHKSDLFLITILILSLGFGFSLVGFSVVLLFFAALATLFLIRQISIKRIGGITGDVAGAMVELTEVIVLITFLSL